MPTSPEFVAFVLDLLAPLGPVEARAMFGGHGLYARGVMFGLLDGDELFLKTDARCREAFVEAGCRRWSFVSKTQRMENTSYFRPPDEAHEDGEAMRPWARLALDAALRARAEKARRAAARATRAAPPEARSSGARGSARAKPGAPPSVEDAGRGPADPGAKARTPRSPASGRTARGADRRGARRTKPASRRPRAR